MKNYFDIKNLSKVYEDFYNRVESEKSGSIFGACEPFKIAMASAFEHKILYVTADFVTAGRVLEMFQSLFGKRAQMLKPAPDNFTFSRAKNNETNIDNLVTLSRLASGEVDVLVLPVSAVLSLYPTKQAILNNFIKIKVDEKIEPSALAEKLVKAGYKREDLVSAPCQFALRGDILDVFPMQAETMYRVEFFDQYIESICELDGATMKKGKSVKAIEILPCSNVFFEENEVALIQKYLDKCLERKFEDGTEKEEYVKNINDLKFKLENETSGFSLDYIFPLIKNKSSIFDYIKDFAVLIDECKMVYDESISFEREKTEQIKRLEKDNVLLSKTGNTFEFSEFLNELPNHISVAFQKITNTNRFFNPKVVSRYTHNLALLAKDLKKYDFDGYRSILFAKTQQDAEYLKKTLLNSGVEYDISNPDKLSETNSSIIPKEFASGFILPDEKIFVLGTYDILPRKAKENKLKVQRSNVFSIPKVGDYVVHSFHGIGICEGVTKLSGNFGTKDYVVVRYRDGDKLYVPIDQMNMLDKFSGAEAPKRLSKIGGELLVETVRKIEEGTAPREKQGDDFSIAPMLNKEMSKIDWENKTATEIKNLVRGLNPFMGAYSFYEGKKIKFWKVDICSNEDLLEKFPELKEFEDRFLDLPEGTVLFSDSKTGLYIKAKDANIKVLEMQGENAKKMTAEEFLRGTSLVAGLYFE